MRSAGCRLQAVARARRGGRRMASDPRDHHSWTSRSSRCRPLAPWPATLRLLKGPCTATARFDVRHPTNTPWTIVRSDTARCAAIHHPAPRPLVPNLPRQKTLYPRAFGVLDKGSMASARRLRARGPTACTLRTVARLARGTLRLAPGPKEGGTTMASWKCRTRN